MAVLGKYTSYKDIIDLVRLRTKTIDDTLISDDLLVKEISIAVSKWAKILNDAAAPFYMTSTTLSSSITGTANPYNLDISAVSPFLSELIRVVHIAGTTRTTVRMLQSFQAENEQQLSSLNSTSLWGIHEGDSIKLYRGSSFTITTASDSVEIKYYRQPIIASVTTASYPDIVDSYIPTIITEVTANVKTYKDMPNDKEVKQLEDDYNGIVAEFQKKAMQINQDVK